MGLSLLSQEMVLGTGMIMDCLKYDGTTQREALKIYVKIL